MAKVDEKLLRVMFPDVSAGDEQVIRKYINDALIGKTAQVDALDESNIRKDVRVTFRDQYIKVTTKAGVKLPKQVFQASIKDLSTGGTCLGVDVEQKVIKNGLATLHLDFVKEGFTIVGKILGLKG